MTPAAVISATATLAARTSANSARSVITLGGFGSKRNVMSPKTASVPSLPTSNAVTS
jgi:hypothetical protein